MEAANDMSCALYLGLDICRVMRLYRALPHELSATRDICGDVKGVWRKGAERQMREGWAQECVHMSRRDGRILCAL